MMPLSRDQIQKPRSPGELTAFVEQVLATVNANKEERKAGQLRVGYFKEFFDEIVPLAKFAAATYPKNYSITPIMGSQGYDAEVRDITGTLVERVEIANPIDGQAVARTGRELAELGRGGFRVGNPNADLEELLPFVASTAKNKAAKDYSDCTVVFNITAAPPFLGSEAHHEVLIGRIKGKLTEVGFKAKRVFVILPSGVVCRVDA
jgi:hypothetical protein